MHRIAYVCQHPNLHQITSPQSGVLKLNLSVVRDEQKAAAAL
jgi:hypothetical protein